MTRTYIARLFSLIIMLLSLCFLNSCHEKGCTDKSALNYNSIADVDDGSCILCQSKTDSTGTVFYDLYDQNSSSMHYNQAVATFYVTQIQNKFTYTECGTSKCYFNLKRFQNTTIQPNSTLIGDSIPTNNITNPCGSLTSSSLYIYTSQNIYYH
jgi:hypothetical protein